MSRRLAGALLGLGVALAACGSNAAPSASAPASASGAPQALPSNPASATSGSSAPGPGASAAPGGGGSPTPGLATEVPTVVPSSAAFTLTSSSFRADGMIPSRFTCDGLDVSPELAWSGAPAGAQRFVLVVVDPDARDFTHWVVVSMPAGTTRLAEGAGAASSQLAQGTNDFGRVGWGGPCPPSGNHRYVFTLYALAAPLGLDGNPNGATVLAALAKAAVLAKASLTARYARGGASHAADQVG